MHESAAGQMHVLCTGWAFRFDQLADGRRQLLSILIPGDLFFAFSLFDPHTRYSVEAITDISYCCPNRTVLMEELASDPNLLDALGSNLATEFSDARDAIVERAESDAKQRIAWFLLRLIRRLNARNIALGEWQYPFPLDNSHLAEATGLAPADLDRAIAALHDSGVVTICRGLLTILSPPKAKRLAAVGTLDA